MNFTVFDSVGKEFDPRPLALPFSINATIRPGELVAEIQREISAVEKPDRQVKLVVISSLEAEAAGESVWTIASKLGLPIQISPKVAAAAVWLV